MALGWLSRGWLIGSDLKRRIAYSKAENWQNILVLKNHMLTKVNSAIKRNFLLHLVVFLAPEIKAFSPQSAPGP
jgi:hypothetical protein